MNISLLSGAYKNAGDFLIVQRCKELLNKNLNNCNIIEYYRNDSIKNVLSDINKSDVIIMGGGPCYMTYLYPEMIPLVDNLYDIKIPIFAMALGWYGNNSVVQNVYDFRFSTKTSVLLKRIDSDGYSLGCRDFLSERVLWKNDLKRTIMTGCSAWYDLNYVEQTRLSSKKDIKKIFISDPANSANYPQFLKLLGFLLSQFPKAEIKVLFHRGLPDDKFNICKDLQYLGISYVDICNSYKGFDLYKECDIHIGYRVHAHIFNLSQRRRSILISEDARGSGVNESLGLRDILAFDTIKTIKTIPKVSRIVKALRKETVEKQVKEEKIICQELLDYIEQLYRNDWKDFEWTFDRMNCYYQNMKCHLKELNG